MQQKNIYSWLVAFGAIPFLLAAIVPFFGIVTIPFFGDIKPLADLYMLAIVSFMAGSHWGVVIGESNNEKFTNQGKQLLIVSNVFVLIPWLLISLNQSILFYISLLVIFILLRTIDAKLANLGVISQHYFRMRCHITMIVVTCTVLMIINQV